MYIILVFLAAGVMMLVYGIREQKNVFGKPNYATARVVGHESVKSTNLALTAVNAASGMVHPVVELVVDDGSTVRAVLYTQVVRASFERYPELDIGGEIDVLYFGDRPIRCFLQNHPLAQTVSRTSAALVGGILLLLLAGVFIYFYLTF